MGIATITLDSQDTKSDLLRRLSRIEGQVRGVRRMVEEDRECREIAQQLAAIRSATQQTSAMVLRLYAGRCLADGDEAARGQALDDLITLLVKAA